MGDGRSGKHLCDGQTSSAINPAGEAFLASLAFKSPAETWGVRGGARPRLTATFVMTSVGPEGSLLKQKTARLRV